MSGIDYASYLSHDARWWLNQYFEYYNTFGHKSIVAFNAFNHSGLIINSAYPQALLKIIETPLVLLHIQNPYIVMGSITLTLVIGFVIIYYFIIKKLNLPNPYLMALFMTSLLILTGRGIVNSTPQLIATLAILIGVLAIVDTSKSYLMIISIFGMLMSSFTTSIIGAAVLISIFFIKPSLNLFWKLTGYSAIGLVMALPYVISILKVTSKVQSPYQDGMQDGLYFFIIHFPFKWQGYVFITTAMFVLLIPYLSKSADKLNKYIARFILIYIIISAFPIFASNIMAPIQKGTFQRIWTYFAIISLFWIMPVLKLHHKKLITLFTFMLLGASYGTYVYYPLSTAKQTPFVKAYHKKDWESVYSILDSNIYLRDNKTRQLLLAPSLKFTTKYSPDYIPYSATINENIIVRLNKNALLKRYGVSKTASGSNTVTVRVKPKSAHTPLGVWHYDFVKYNTSLARGKLSVKNGLYYYNGKEPTTIKITAVKLK